MKISKQLNLGNLKAMFKKGMQNKAIIGATLLIGTTTVMAGAGNVGGGDPTFDGVVTFLNDLLDGSFGRLIALAMFIVGIVMGIMRQSIMAAVPAVAVAIAIAVAPDVIENVFTAALPF